MLGLQLVPSDIAEAGVMSGCTPRQRFWMVDVPTAAPQLFVGINQTTMASFQYHDYFLYHWWFRGHRLGSPCFNARGRIGQACSPELLLRFLLW